MPPGQLCALCPVGPAGKGNKLSLTPLHSDGALEAGVLHVAGVHIPSLGRHFQHHQDLERPVPIPNEGRGHDALRLLLVVPEPPDFDVSWIEICHRANKHVVVVQSLCLGWKHGHCRFH